MVSAGGSGIGRAIVEGFVAQGAKVATCDINPDFVNDVKTALPNVMAQVVDVGDETAVQAFCAAAIEHLGGLDCLINNAGIAGPTLPVEEIDATDWNACLNICLNSQFYFSKACIPSLRQSGDASITTQVKVWAPDFNSPWHYHPYQCVAHIIQGELTVNFDTIASLDDKSPNKSTSITKTFKTGEAFIGTANTWHYSQNLGSEDLIFTTSWLAEKDAPIAILVDKE